MKFLKRLPYFLMAMIMGLSLTFTSCDDDNTDEPDGPKLPEANLTIENLIKKYDGTLLELTEDIVVEGVVISNQSVSSNFYQRLVVQGEKGGIHVKVYKSDYADALAIGQKVVISAKGLFLGEYAGTPQLGVKYNDGIGGIDDTKAQEVIKKVEGGTEPTPKAISITEVSDALINTLVKIP